MFIYLNFDWHKFQICIYTYSLIIHIDNLIELDNQTTLVLTQKWWRIVLEIEISCNQWKCSTCVQSALILFILSFGLGRGAAKDFFPFVPLKFPMSSHQVPNMFPRFPIFSPRVLPITPHSNSICFAQSPPLLTYTCGPKGGGTSSFHRIFYSGEPL
jgi:hypothetical protein